MSTTGQGLRAIDRTTGQQQILIDRTAGEELKTQISIFSSKYKQLKIQF
jgi:hypothetical protein